MLATTPNEAIGFQLKNGSTVRLVVALEVEDKKGKFRYVTAERDMSKLGFGCLDYDCIDFVPCGLENPEGDQL